MTYSYYCYGCLLLVAVLCGDVFSEPTKKNISDEGVSSLEDLSTISKRQTNVRNNNFNQQQIQQEYLEYIQQTNDAINPVPEQSTEFEQQNGQQIYLARLPSDKYPSMTTTTYSPFATEQVRFQEEYAHRVLVSQQAALLKPRKHVTLPVPTDFQVSQSTPSPRPIQQPEQLQFLDPSTGQVRQQEIFVQQPQNLASVQGEGPFSYAQVQFGPGPVAGNRPKGQRSVSRPRPNRVVVEPVAQQTVDYLATTVRPVQLTYRMLQNVVYIQPNGQMYKPIEDTESVVHIPRKNYYNYQQVDESGTVTPGPAIGASSTTTTAVSVEEEPLVLIPRPKKLNPSRPRLQEGRKVQRTQQIVNTERPPSQQQQAVRTEWPQQQQQKLLQQQHQEQQQQEQYQQEQYQQEQQQQRQQLEQLYQQQLSSEVEPDNFLTTLLSRFQQKQQRPQHQQEQETTVETVHKPRGGQRSNKGGDRSNTSKLLPERSQLQLLQFPDELKSLSLAELKALERASTQISDHNDKSVIRQKQLFRNRQAAVSPTAASTVATTTHLPPPPPQLTEIDDELQRHFPGNRPVPTPVELSEEQRKFLATQGIRHLYRVDYDQAGNALPLTYVLALDNRPKRDDELQ